MTTNGEVVSWGKNRGVAFVEADRFEKNYKVIEPQTFCMLSRRSTN
jgi:hypothetical protein